MKKEEKNGFSVAKCKKGGSSEHHVQRSSIPITAVWPLGLAISRSLMTVVRAASEKRLGRGVAWKLHDRGLKKTQQE